MVIITAGWGNLIYNLNPIIIANISNKTQTTAPSNATLILHDCTISDKSKLRAFAEGMSNVAPVVAFSCKEVEDIVRKGENADNQHFLTMFPKSPLSQILEFWLKVETPKTFFFF